MPDKPLDIPRLWKDRDREQDLVAAKLRADKEPPPLDQAVLKREHRRMEKRLRTDRRIAAKTVALESLLTEPSVPDHTEALMALDSYRAMLRAATDQQAVVVDAMVRLGMRRREVALMLGITQRAATRALQRALLVIKTTVAPDV